MGDAFIDSMELFPRGLVYVGMGIVILVIAKLAQDLITPYKINDQLRTKDNVALALSITGYYLGTVIVFLGAVYQPFVLIDGLGFTSDYWKDVLEVFLTSLAGIVVLNVARIAVDKLILYKLSTEKEIISNQNAGAGAVEFGVYVAVGLVIGGSVAGEAGGPETSLAFVGLGLVTLVLYTLFYELTTAFDVHEQIEGNNTAIGVALAANLIAIGIVTFKAVFGEFVNWEDSPGCLLDLRRLRVRPPSRHASGSRLRHVPASKGGRRAGKGPQPGCGINPGCGADQRQPHPLLRGVRVWRLAIGSEGLFSHRKRGPRRRGGSEWSSTSYLVFTGCHSYEKRVSYFHPLGCRGQPTWTILRSPSAELRINSATNPSRKDGVGPLALLPSLAPNLPRFFATAQNDISARHQSNLLMAISSFEAPATPPLLRPYPP